MLANNSNHNEHNSPPLEGCPKDGVVLTTVPKDDQVLTSVPKNEELLSSTSNYGFDYEISKDTEIHLQISANNTSKIIQKKYVFKQQPDIFIRNIPLMLTPIIELPCNIALRQRAKELRQARNLPEVLFWMQVTKGRFYKIDFDRQRIIGNYIVDFYVKKLGLIIEIDGSSHIGKEEYDKAREDYLISLGLTIYRIQVIDIMQRMGMVIWALENFILKWWGEKD